MTDEPIQPLDEQGKWHARDAIYYAGTWRQLSTLVPRFELTDFKAEGGDVPNPYMKSVVRMPRTLFEKPVPVGVVSNTYSLAQHHAVAEQCLQGIQETGIDPTNLRCELGLTQLGEWMNLRVYFPERYRFVPRPDDWLDLRLECFNSVDGSSRLFVVFGWLRFVCSNGMVIGETKHELKDIHDQHLDLQQIPQMISDSMWLVKNDIVRLQKWQSALVKAGQLRPWANKDVAKAWGKKAACRVFHICMSGHDIDFPDPFAGGEATDKPVRKLEAVPGQPKVASNLYDVSQAMAWVASKRNDTEERLNWQTDIPRLIENLATPARDD
jgi:hypothetical protein